MLKKWAIFFSEELWDFHLSDKHGYERFFYKWLRICCLSIRKFFQDECNLAASSLTYYTLMSIVPILSMSLAFANAFGYHEILRRDLLEHFQDQNGVLTALFEYADRLLPQASGGLITGIGLLLLFWSIVLLLNRLEKILNRIWDVKKMRSWKRLFSDYFAILVIGPFFFILFNSISVFVVAHLQAGVSLLPIGPFGTSPLLLLVQLIPYALFGLLFSFIYLFMPNAKVSLVSALLGGIFTGYLYVVVQCGYIYFQTGVSRYGAVYGSMAALPLFLIWVQLSWFLLLLGAEISHAHQTSNLHEFEKRAGRVSQSFKRLLSLWMVHLCMVRFLEKQTPITRDLLVERYRIPVALVAPILKELIGCGLLIECRGGLIPGRSPEELRISDVLRALDQHGTHEFPFLESKILAPFEAALDQFRLQIENSPQNQLLKHVSHSF
jgi:membrane protein